MNACLMKQKKASRTSCPAPPLEHDRHHTRCKKQVRTHTLTCFAVGKLVLFLIVINICFYALEFQRKVLELLVEIRDGLKDLNLKDAETTTLPAQVTTIEELTQLDETLSSATERQTLVGFTTVT